MLVVCMGLTRVVAGLFHDPLKVMGNEDDKVTVTRAMPSVIPCLKKSLC